MKLILDDNDAIALIESLVRECVVLRTELATSRATADDALTRWQEVADQRGEQLSAIAKEHEAEMLAASETHAARVNGLSAELVRRVDLAHQNAKKVMELAELADRRGQRIEALEDLGKAYDERLVAAAERLKNLEAELSDVYAQKRTLQASADQRGERLSTIAKEYEARLSDAGRQIGALDMLAHQRKMRIEELEAEASTDLKLAQAHIARLQQTIDRLTAQRQT